MKEVQALTESFVGLDNPFAEDSDYLIALGAKDIMPHEAVQTVNTLTIGQKQHDRFIEDRLVTSLKSLSVPFHKNKLPCAFKCLGIKGKV